MSNDSLSYIPVEYRRPLAIALIAAVLAGGIAAGVAVIDALNPKKESSSTETWDRIQSYTDPCVFEAFARDRSNDPALRRAAEERQRALGPCLSDREREELAEQQARDRIAAEEQAAAEEAERARAAQVREDQRRALQLRDQQTTAQLNQRDDDAFERARRANTSASYTQYLTTYPRGRHSTAAREAQRRLTDDAAFANARRTHTSAAYSSYLSSYPNGRHAAEARTAMESVRPPHDAGQLPRSVRRAVEGARSALSTANTSASNARRAQENAERAAQRARNARSEQEDGSLYAGEQARDRAEGYGVLEFSRGGREGERYAGQWREGRKEGLGVFSAPSRQPWNTSAWRRFEGQFTANRPHGYGVFHRSTGQYLGMVSEGQPQGSGTFVYSNGERYEGEWVRGVRQGPGVLWTRDGRVSQVGNWASDRLAATSTTTP